MRIIRCAAGIYRYLHQPLRGATRHPAVGADSCVCPNNKPLAPQTGRHGGAAPTLGDTQPLRL